jgi:hypothetical protein
MTRRGECLYRAQSFVIIVVMPAIAMTMIVAVRCV